MASTFIDLGLPSGTLWATENAVIDGKAYFNFDEAVKTFGKHLPSAETWNELFDLCRKSWDESRKGIIFTAPNKKTLFLPANGYKKDSEQKDAYLEGVYCRYWTSTPYGDEQAYVQNLNAFKLLSTVPLNRTICLSVRLCKQA